MSQSTRRVTDIPASATISSRQ